MTVYYERLSNLDASFLALESRSTHMHVGAVAIFGQGPHTRERAWTSRRFATCRARLDSIPRYRQRLATVPVEGTPCGWMTSTSNSTTTFVTSPCRIPVRRPAQGPGGTADVPATRQVQAAVGAQRRRGTRRWRLRDRLEDSPLHDRWHVRHRPDGGDPRLHAGCRDRGTRAVEARPARPNGTELAVQGDLQDDLTVPRRTRRHLRV